MAEAIAAKAVLLTDNRLMRRAAETSPKDPYYWYLAGAGLYYNLITMMTADLNDTSRPDPRPLFERALRTDSNYLPALYAYAMSKPKYEERQKALLALATKDSDNAEPYYLMAIDQFRRFDERKFVKSADDLGARDLSPDEWQEISGIIEQGNKRALAWRLPRVPSSSDVTAIIRRKTLPAPTTQGLLASSLAGWGGTEDSAFDPGGFLTQARYRQMARQAVWAARLADKAGDKAKAMHYLDVMMDLGYRLAFCKPERLLSFDTGYCVWLIAESEKVDMLKRPGRMPEAWKLDQERLAWRGGLKQMMPLLGKVLIKDKSVKTSRTEYLQYSDQAAEQAGMKKILAGLKP